MTKIQLKRSSVVDSGSAKKPTAAQMEYGELAVNYSSADPALFIKDNNDNIVRIAGANNVGTDGNGATGEIGYWERTSTTLSPVNTNDSVKVGSGNISLNADGSASFVSKVTSGSTASSDADTTLTTKDYVDSAVSSNNGRTNISITHAATTATVNSSTGANGQINAATTSLAGVMTAADKTKFNGIEAGAQVNVGTNLSNTPSTTSVAVNSSTGNNTTIPAATSTTAGVMTAADKAKFDNIDPGAEANVGTNLSSTQSTTSVSVNSSTGTDTSISAATTSLAGVMTAADKTKLNNIEAGAQVNVGTNLGNTPSATNVSVNSSTGASTSIPAATTTKAGVMTAADRTKLNGIETGAEANVGTNLSNTPSANNVAVNSSTGTNTSIPAATTSLAGVMTSADKTKLDSIPEGGGYWSRTGTTLSPVNSGDDVSVQDIKVSGTYSSFSTRIYDFDIDCSSGNYFRMNVDETGTFTFSNVPADVYSFTIELYHTGGLFITWPDSVKFPGNVAPSLAFGKVNLFMFVTQDGGNRFRATAITEYDV